MGNLGQNLKREISKFHYSKEKSLKNFILYLALFVPSAFYSAAVRFKNFLYEKKFLKEEKVEGVKIICIGNLTTGGVGKTPVVLEFAKYFAPNKKTAVLSRGYGGKLKGANIIKDYDKLLIDDPAKTGDEIRLLADNSKGFCTVTSANRALGAKFIKKETGAEIIIMDDGFSNRQVEKDLTLLLFDMKKFIGNGRILPLGPLRESICEVKKRADGIILIDKEDISFERSALLKKFVGETFNKPVFSAKFTPDFYYDIKTNEKVEIEKGAPAFAFCAIGQSEQFFAPQRKTLDLKGTKDFDDHHLYMEDEIKKIKEKAEKCGAKYILTTEKDAVKLREFECAKGILGVKLRVEINVEEIIKTLLGGKF